MTPASTLMDAPLVFSDPALGAEWRPENYSRSFRGATTMREALANSRNLASIRLLNTVGVNKTHDNLGRFGLNLRGTRATCRWRWAPAPSHRWK
jgi:penicillin-binding protein 1A